MKFERDEIIGMAVSVAVVAGFFAAMRYDVWSLMGPDAPQDSAEAQVLEDAIILKGSDDMAGLIAKAFNQAGRVNKLVVQDVATGEGAKVEQGSRVAVHYVGMLQNGTTFENTYESGEPYRFTVGMGDVIEGWDRGLMGMRAGGERILVVPPQLGYGSRVLDGIPADSTLLFSVELLSVE